MTIALSGKTYQEKNLFQRVTELTVTLLQSLLCNNHGLILCKMGAFRLLVGKQMGCDIMEGKEKLINLICMTQLCVMNIGRGTTQGRSDPAI